MEGKESLQLYNKAIELIKEAMENQSTLDINIQPQGREKIIQKTFKTNERSDINESSCFAAKQNGNFLKGTPPDGILETLKRELSNVYCAVAELWMTDLCDESEAECECTAVVAKAVECDESNPEAWQTKARLHLVKREFKVIIYYITFWYSFKFEHFI